MTGDMGEFYNGLREDRRKRRAELGVSCPGCRVTQPKRTPTILLPGQRCRVCGYRDPRPYVRPPAGEAPMTDPTIKLAIDGATVEVKAGDTGGAPAIDAPVSGVARMRAICDALGFDPTNHHNAAKCPYCNWPPSAARSAGPAVGEIDHLDCLPIERENMLASRQATPATGLRARCEVLEREWREKAERARAASRATSVMDDKIAHATAGMHLAMCADALAAALGDGEG